MAPTTPESTNQTNYWESLDENDVTILAKSYTMYKIGMKWLIHYISINLI